MTDDLCAELRDQLNVARQQSDASHRDVLAGHGRCMSGEALQLNDAQRDLRHTLRQDYGDDTILVETRCRRIARTEPDFVYGEGFVQTRGMEMTAWVEHRTDGQLYDIVRRVDESDSWW